MRTRLVAVLAVAFALAVRADPPATVPIPLTGLTEENRAAVTAGLMALARTEYACAAHPGTAADKPGACATCQAPLAERKAPLLASAEAAVEGRSVTLTIAPGRALLLTQVFAALEAGPARLDAGRFALEGPVTLHISGMRCPN